VATHDTLLIERTTPRVLRLDRGRLADAA